jgi:hypothetical protein
MFRACRMGLCLPRLTLYPLERGMHALAATEKGKHGKSVKAYAEQVGRKPATVADEVNAAKVVASLGSTPNFTELVKRTQHLTEIKTAPELCWPALVTRLVEEKWNVEATKSLCTGINFAISGELHYRVSGNLTPRAKFITDEEFATIWSAKLTGE